MAVRIRLRRLGGKRDAFFRIVVADSRTARDGQFIEELGFYDPVDEPAKTKIDVDRATYWLSQGAQPSQTVRDLFRRAGILDGGRSDEEEDASIEFELVKSSALNEDAE